MKWLDKIKTRSWATPLCIGTFIVVGFSGMLMVFEINIGMLKLAHEWIGVLLVIGVVMHVLNNNRMFMKYFTKTAAVAITVIFVIAGSVMAFMGNGRRHQPPFMAASRMLQDSSITVIAPIAKATPESIIDQLKKQGITVTDPNQTINQIARNNNKEPMMVLSAVLGNETDENQNGMRNRNRFGRESDDD